MRFPRTTAALAAALLLGSLAGCADYTTTGVPDGEERGERGGGRHGG